MWCNIDILVIFWGFSTITLGSLIELYIRLKGAPVAAMLEDSMPCFVFFSYGRELVSKLYQGQISRVLRDITQGDRTRDYSWSRHRAPIFMEGGSLVGGGVLGAYDMDPLDALFPPPSAYWDYWGGGGRGMKW